jgi:hypothetical protein
MQSSKRESNDARLKELINQSVWLAIGKDNIGQPYKQDTAITSIETDIVVIVIMPIVTILKGLLKTAEGLIRMALSVLSLGHTDTIGHATNVALAGVGMTLMSIVSLVIGPLNLAMQAASTLNQLRKGGKASDNNKITKEATLEFLRTTDEKTILSKESQILIKKCTLNMNSAQGLIESMGIGYNASHNEFQNDGKARNSATDKMLNDALYSSIHASFGPKFAESYKFEWKNNPFKDMLMIVIQPLIHAVIGSLQTSMGLIGIVGSVFAENKLDSLSASTNVALSGVGIALLAVISPAARALNLTMRFIATFDAGLKVLYDSNPVFKELTEVINRIIPQMKNSTEELSTRPTSIGFDF